MKIICIQFNLTFFFKGTLKIFSYNTSHLGISEVIYSTLGNLDGNRQLIYKYSKRYLQWELSGLH